jgi:hypothetical protein
MPGKVGVMSEQVEREGREEAEVPHPGLQKGSASLCTRVPLLIMENREGVMEVGSEPCQLLPLLPAETEPGPPWQ